MNRGRSRQQGVDEVLASTRLTELSSRTGTLVSAEHYLPGRRATRRVINCAAARHADSRREQREIRRAAREA